MSLIILQPTVNQTPDAGQGGTAVTSPSNTGHGSTNVTGVSGGSQTKTCRWFNFQSTAGLVLDIKLKLSWAESGSVIPISLNSFSIEYSLNNGSSWNTVISHAGVVNPDSGNETINIPPQDISIIQVRDTISASDINGGQADLSASVSDIKLEVTVDDTNPVFIG